MQRNLIHIRAQMGCLEDIAPLRLFRLCKEVHQFFEGDDLPANARSIILLHSFAQLGIECYLAEGTYQNKQHYWIMAGARLYDPTHMHTGSLRKPYILHKLSEVRTQAMKEYIPTWRTAYTGIAWDEALRLFQNVQNTQPIVQSPQAILRFQKRAPKI